MQERLASRFRGSLLKLERTHNRLESLYSNGAISKQDLDTVYEGLLLRAVTEFESFVEELFIKIMLQRTTYPVRRVKPRIEIRSPIVLREVMFAGQEYLEWLPYSHTLNRAEIFLRGGRPFSQLTGGDKGNLAQLIRIRNAIAHSSDHALEQFRNKVIGSLNLPPPERSPAGYLRSQVRINPSLTRFQLVLSNLSTISYRLT